MLGTRRLFVEYKKLQKQPVEHIIAKPREEDVFEWHYVITGPPGSPYEGGLYWGKLVFPSQYPMKMEETPTTGAIRGTPEQRRRYARDSLQWNCKQPVFRTMFPELAAEGDTQREQWEEQQREEDAHASASTASLTGAGAGGDRGSGVGARVMDAVQAPAGRGLLIFCALVLSALVVLIVLLTR